jgi:uncharacterized protein YgbK (DUF1537 family)
MDVVALAVFRAMKRGKRFLFRAAAAIIPALIGLTPRSLPAVKGFPQAQKGCGLIIVGSFVPISSHQLKHLLKHGGVQGIELEVKRLLSGDWKIEIDRVTGETDRSIGSCCDTVIYTSRDLVTGATAEKSIRIQAKVAGALIKIVQGIRVVPRYILAKGGATSHDIATKALGVKRAVVRGQIAPGVPVWELSGGSRFPGMIYIVFPGNVGTETSITDVVQVLSSGSLFK